MAVGGHREGRQMTFVELMRRVGTASAVLAAIKALALPGRVVRGARVWSLEEAARIVMHAKGK